MKKCVNCNYDNLDEANFCLNCGTDIKTSNFTYINNTEQVVNNSNVNIVQKPNQVPMSEEDKKKANILCIISLICTLGPTVLTTLLSMLGIPNVLRDIITYSDGFLGLTGIVLMIIARVNYPQSKFAKIVMWIYIVLFIILVILLLIVLIFLGFLLYSCKGYNGP